MSRTSTAAEILRILGAAPHTSSQLADICGLHQRYVRRILAQLVAAGAISSLQNPADRRSCIYCITTGQQAGPQNMQDPTDSGPQKRPLILGSKIGDICGKNDALPNQAQILRDCNQKIGDQIEDQNRGPFDQKIGDLTAQTAAIGEIPPSMHGKPENPPQLRPGMGVPAEIGDQNRGPAHPGTCSITDHPSGHVCHSCPLAVCDLEHDTIQIGIVDAWTSNYLVRLAESKRWERRKNPHTGVLTVYPPALHPLTLQLAVDTVTIYSSEPGNTEWIVAWFALQVGAVHPHPDQLAHKLRHPEIYRDEQTIVITDQPTQDALMSVSAPWADPISGVRYIPSPNTVTPALKIYQRSTGEVRMEFDARTETTARAALVMRQELLLLLPRLALHPGLWLEWQQRYYNPVVQPVVINLDQDAVVAAINNLGATLGHRMDALEAHIQPETDDLQALIAAVDAMTDFQLQEVIDLLCQYIGDTTAANVYLAAWALWANSKFRRPIQTEDVTGDMRRRDIPISHAAAVAAIRLLIAKGLLAPHPDRDINFSRAAIRIGRKLIAREQNPEETTQ